MKKKKERKREKIFAIHTHSPNLVWSNRLQGTAASKVNIVLFPIRFIVYLLISFCSAKKMEIVQLHTQKRSNRTNESKRKDEEKTLDRHANNGSKDAVDSFFDSYVLLCMFLFFLLYVYIFHSGVWMAEGEKRLSDWFWFCAEKSHLIYGQENGMCNVHVFMTMKQVHWLG